MKKKFMQQILTFAATALACAAVLTVTPNPDAPDPEFSGGDHGIENSEDGEGEQPGAEPQNDRDTKDERYD